MLFNNSFFSIVAAACLIKKLGRPKKVNNKADPEYEADPDDIDLSTVPSGKAPANGTMPEIEYISRKYSAVGYK